MCIGLCFCEFMMIFIVFVNCICLESIGFVCGLDDVIYIGEC